MMDLIQLVVDELRDELLKRCKPNQTVSISKQDIIEYGWELQFAPQARIWVSWSMGQLCMLAHNDLLANNITKIICRELEDPDSIDYFVESMPEFIIWATSASSLEAKTRALVC